MLKSRDRNPLTLRPSYCLFSLPLLTSVSPDSPAQALMALTAHRDRSPLLQWLPKSSRTPAKGAVTPCQLNVTPETLSDPCLHKKGTWMLLVGKHLVGVTQDLGTTRLPRQDPSRAQPSRSWEQPSSLAGSFCFADLLTTLEANLIKWGASLQGFPFGAVRSLPCVKCAAVFCCLKNVY